MCLHIIGNRSGHIGNAAPDIAVVVAIRIHCPFTVARRHKLRQAHCAGVAAGKAERIFALFTAHQQQFIQFFLEKLTATRVFKRQGRQCIGHTKATGIAAVVGFNADNGNDDFSRYAVLARGLINHLTVLLIETLTTGNLGGTGIALTELIPRIGSTRSIHDIDDIAFIGHVVEETEQLVTAEAVMFDLIIDKRLYIRVGIETGSGHAVGSALVKMRHTGFGHRFNHRFSAGIRALWLLNCASR